MYYRKNLICWVLKILMHCPLVLLKSVRRYSRILKWIILCTYQTAYYEQLQYLGRASMFAFGWMHFGNTRVTLNLLY